MTHQALHNALQVAGNGVRNQKVGLLHIQQSELRSQHAGAYNPMHAPLRQGRGVPMQSAPSDQGFHAGTVLVSKQTYR